MNAKSYKSPKSKLIAFFEKSRNQWKERAQEYYRNIRSFEVRVRDLEASRDHWREQYFAQRSVKNAPTPCEGDEPPPAPISRRSSAAVLKSQT